MQGIFTILLYYIVCYSSFTSREKRKNARAKQRQKNQTGNLLAPVGKENINMVNLENWNKLFLGLAPKISKEEIKTVKTVLRLLVVHANPSVVWYAMSELKKSLLARIADKMSEIASEDDKG